MAWHDGLTEKQRRFCEAFSSNGGNATRAARMAGYAKPDPTGSENLGNPRILQAIEDLRQATTKAEIASRERRQQFWTEIMLNADEQTRDRLKASELLGKSQGDFIDRHELSGPHGSPLECPVIHVTFPTDHPG